MSIFQPIAHNYHLNSIPIILVDISGSTGDSFITNKTVREYEFTIAEQLCKKYAYTQAHIIVWSTHAQLYKNVQLEKFGEVKGKTASNGGTELTSGLDCIDDSFLYPDRMTEILIITDGEVQDDKKSIIEKFTKLMQHPIQIKIIAVEPNDVDYYDVNARVGNQLYKIIRDGKLTRLVERFSVYNRREIEFINMSNPKVKAGYLPYDTQMFAVTDFNLFVSYIKKEITELLTNDCQSRILKLIQNLSLTIYHHTKNKSYYNQLLIVDLFSNLLRGTRYFSDMRSLLLNEVNNHITGQISTFTEMKKARYLKIENTFMDLMNDTQKAVSPQPKDIAYSFMLLDKNGNHYIIKSYDRTYTSIKIGPTTYKNCAISIDHYQVPLLFDFDGANTSASQWIKLIYSYRLNLSISNEYLYYYVLCDAYLSKNSEVSCLYDKYVDLLLNEYKYGTDVTICQDIEKTNMINIPYNILQDASNYCGVQIRPSTLYYLVCLHYLLKYVKDQTPVISNLRSFCQKDLLIDLKDDIKYTNNWNLIEKDIHQLNWSPIQVIIINHDEMTFMKRHQYLDDLDCPGRNGINHDGVIVCELCGVTVDYTTVEKNLLFEQINDITSQYVFDIQRHIHLGLLNGYPDDNQLVVPDRFDTPSTSYSVDNTIIVDPVSNSRLKITNRKDFIKVVDQKYPFLRDINMSNVALCGGFVRSILLKQSMKDFDFFFYGLKSEQEYIERVKSLTMDIIKALGKLDPTYKFAVFYKPMFNVIEMICYEDPKIHIKEDFTLDYFDQYKFKTMKKYRRTEMAESGCHHKKKKEQIDMKYYFEDNDEHGVKMKYRLQLVMCQYNTIMDIFRSFDMFPSMVAYDGQQVYFTTKSLIAFQFMINEINLRGGTDLVKHRVSKYFKYGFSIIFPSSTRNWHNTDYENDYSQEDLKYKGTNENIGPLKFKIRQIHENTIYINHDSNIEQLLERNQKLEKKAKKKYNALYTSSMFCSFVAVLRYIKINNINYAFPTGDAIHNLFEGNSIKLKQSTPLTFLSEQKTIYKTTDWYDKFIRSIILNNYHE